MPSLARVRRRSHEERFQRVELGYQTVEVDLSTAMMPQPGPQTDFLSTCADIAVYGGSAGGGKSWALLAEASRNTDDPRYGGVIFRRTYPEITNEGGLWDESEVFYGALGARPIMDDLRWKFPAGADVRFNHMQYEQSKLLYQGSQIPFIGFDELTHFTESQFFYMLSRNRPGAGCYVKPYIRASTNPDAQSWVKKFLAPWVDDEYYEKTGDRAASGELRWFIRVDGLLVWAKSPAELLRKYPKARPKSVTFVRSSVYDNKILLAKNPEYLASLEALPYVERRRLLDGDWNVVASGNMFRYEWFGDYLQAVPNRRIRWCRFWDIAASEVKEGKEPDWTAGCLLGVDDFGTYYIADMQLLQGTPAQVEKLIKDTAVSDYRAFGRIPIGMEQEPGASGITVCDHFEREVLKGYDFKGYRDTGNKIERAKAISALCERGRLKIVDGPWVQKVLGFFVAFPRKKVKDDPVDACSGAHMRLNEISDIACTVDPLLRVAGVSFQRND